MMEDIVLRASSVGTTADCGLRWAAGALRREFIAAGYEVRQTGFSVAAALGTALHAGAYEILIPRLQSGTRDLGSLLDAHAAAVEAFAREMERDTEMDDTTRSFDVGVKQLLRMLTVYQEQVAPDIHPVRLEQRVTARISSDPGVMISGQSDVVAEAPAIHDTKTSARGIRPHIYQLGTYINLENTIRAQEGSERVKGAVIDTIPRSPISKPQGNAARSVYEAETAARIAHFQAQRVVRDVREWRLRHDAMVFQANPNSMLCSDKFCSLHGTKTCAAWRR